jgi:undecaprenyl-diphosphatase
MRIAALRVKVLSLAELTGRGLALVARSDARMLQRVGRLPVSGRLACALRAASHLGDGWLWVGTAAVLAAGSGERPGPLAAGATAAALTNLCLVAAKRGVRRERPPRLFAGIAPPDPYTFPSGHTANAFAACSVLAASFPQATPALAVLALCIAASRVLLGVHYPSDVLAGGALGSGAAIFSLELLAP